MAIFTPLTGLLIDYYSEDPNSTDYTPAFYIYDVLLALSLISVFLLPVGKKLPSESILRHLWDILKLPHVLMFLFFLFYLGTFWGFIESYLFVIMKEMGSPNYLLGLTYTVGTVASIPMMYLTGPITRWAGHVNLLVVAFFAHATRIIGYSLMDNPFWCFPVELNEAISCYFMWVVATTYCAVLAPNSLVATLIGVSGMVHFCLGKGIGSVFGGYLIAQFGTRMAFRYMGYIAVVCGCSYKFLHLIWLKKYDKHQAGEIEDRKRDFPERRVSLVPKFSAFGSVAGMLPTSEEEHAKSCEGV
ncbi:AAEL013039-PA [Aedes aegypti]|nr:AAEL013039-PA [Aedes aegypti]